MKKSLFFGFAAVVALSSCTTNEEVLNVKEYSDLSFGTFVDKSTKAPVATLETPGKDFTVWGYHIANTASEWTTPEVLWANGETVTRGSSAWGYTNTKQWIPNRQYRFLASSPAAVAATCTPSAGTLTFTDFTVVPTIADQTDLLVATRYERNTTDFSNTAINFTFKHILSKVKVAFNTTSLYPIKLTEVKLSGIGGKGSCVATPDVSTATDAAINAVWTLGEANLLNFNGGLNSDASLPATTVPQPFISLDELLMIPQTFDAEKPLQLLVKYTVDGKGDPTDVDNSVFTKTLNITGAWESGHSITYLVTINTGNGEGSGNDITFGMTTVVGWTNDSSIPEAID